jgi:hypothetical protein
MILIFSTKVKSIELSSIAMFQRRPPAKVVWKEIEKNTETTGHLAYYYSNDESELPVRAVGKKWDNKSDPNIETKSYGMFSTCMPPHEKTWSYEEIRIFSFSHIGNNSESSQVIMN